MKLIFYIFVFSQLFNLLDVLAEKIKKEPSKQKIKWERVKDEKSNNLKKIIWKSYKNDESYESIGTGFFIKKDIIVFGVGVFVFIILTLWFIFRNINLVNAQ